MSTTSLPIHGSKKPQKDRSHVRMTINIYRIPNPDLCNFSSIWKWVQSLFLESLEWKWNPSGVKAGVVKAAAPAWRIAIWPIRNRVSQRGNASVVDHGDGESWLICEARGYPNPGKLATANVRERNVVAGAISLLSRLFSYRSPISFLSESKLVVGTDVYTPYRSRGCASPLHRWWIGS